MNAEFEGDRAAYFSVPLCLASVFPSAWPGIVSIPHTRQVETDARQVECGAPYPTGYRVLQLMLDALLSVSGAAKPRVCHICSTSTARFRDEGDQFLTAMKGIVDATPASRR